jgi:hypothetical protein
MATTYRITVVTGAVEYAGTDANVYITLFGSNGNSGERLLDNAADNFERGTTDVFDIQMRDIGEIRRIRIRHDNWGNCPGWFLERVIVHKEDTDEEWVFPCHRWLAYDEQPGEVDILLDPA